MIEAMSIGPFYCDKCNVNFMLKMNSRFCPICRNTLTFFKSKVE